METGDTLCNIAKNLALSGRKEKSVCIGKNENLFSICNQYLLLIEWGLKLGLD